MGDVIATGLLVHTTALDLVDDDDHSRSIASRAEVNQFAVALE